MLYPQGRGRLPETLTLSTAFKIAVPSKQYTKPTLEVFREIPRFRQKNFVNQILLLSTPASLQIQWTSLYPACSTLAQYTLPRLTRAGSRAHLLSTLYADALLAP